MKDTRDKHVKTINHLLSIERTHGYHEGRIAPILYFFASVFIPAFFVINIYVYLANLFNSPRAAIIIIVIVYILYAIRMALIFLGDEKTRVANYRRRCYSLYDELGEFVKIKNIHPSDGCIEFFDGSIAFMVVAYNGNQDSFNKFLNIQKMLEIIDEFHVEVLVQNTSDGNSLDEFYNKISQFKDKQVASDFLAILDYNKQYISDKSLVVRTAFIVYGKQYDRFALHEVIKESLPSRAYYDVHIANRDEILSIYSHQLQAFIDIDDLIVSRFATGMYYTSRVISYDSEDETIKPMRQKSRDIRNFIPKGKVQ